MINSVVEMYEKEKAVNQKWLDENKELEETTIYAATKLKVALCDVGIVFATAFGEAVESANKALKGEKI
jgi:hypothetical protein